MGTNVIIDSGTRFVNPHHISIGDTTWIDKNVILIAGQVKLKKFMSKKNPNYNGDVGELYIGSRCHISPRLQFKLMVE